MRGLVRPLDRLAELHGIESTYTDISQIEHEVPDATKRALLAAMGVDASDDRAILRAQEAIEAAAWKSGLPPVLVVAIGKPFTSDLILSAARMDGDIVWLLDEESGMRHRGTARVGELDPIGYGWCGPQRQRKYGLRIGISLPPGYHRLTVETPDGEAFTTTIIAAPARSFGLADLDAERPMWGVTAPLYGIRSERNWGIGEFPDLGELAETVSAFGAALVGINPVHALLPALPERASPYSPSSRLFLNPLHIAIEAVPEFAVSEVARTLVGDSGFAGNLDRARNADLVDYASVAALKRPVLRALFDSFVTGCGADSPRQIAFRAFETEQGAALEGYAIFEALFEHFLDLDPACTSWHRWPASFRDPASAEVAAFAAERPDRIAFHKYLQWIAAEQLATAQNRAKAAGMGLGLYLDLAVGVDPGGADSWMQQDGVVTGVHLGAPPDGFNPKGQDWGLAPFNPLSLRRQAYAPFIALLRATMRSAGAMRIDHVLGFNRSFWVPAEKGLPGAYVRYPLDELLALVALESHRQRCLIIGEDLGNVPRGFRDRLAAAGLLGYRVLYFEREGAKFRPAAAYPRSSVASASTHDLPTLRGFWAGRDIDWWERLGFNLDAGQTAQRRQGRARDRQELLQCLEAEGLLPAGIELSDPPGELPWNVVLAIHRFLAETPAGIVLMQMADLLETLEQDNLPGTVDSHPNWRRRLSETTREIAVDPRLKALAEAIAAGRSRATAD